MICRYVVIEFGIWLKSIGMIDNYSKYHGMGPRLKNPLVLSVQTRPLKD